MKITKVTPVLRIPKAYVQDKYCEDTYLLSKRPDTSFKSVLEKALQQQRTKVDVKL